MLGVQHQDLAEDGFVFSIIKKKPHRRTQIPPLAPLVPNETVS
jgi:hypothetical protein